MLSIFETVGEHKVGERGGWRAQDQGSDTSNHSPTIAEHKDIESTDVALRPTQQFGRTLFALATRLLRYSSLARDR
jgi:hypothetical protein